MLTEDDAKESGLIKVTCSLCNKFTSWCYDDNTAKQVLYDHLKEKHEDIYDPMKISIERQKE